MSDRRNARRTSDTKKISYFVERKTERKETIDLGYSFICGSSKKKIINKFRKLINISDENKKFKRNPFGNGKSSEKIFKFTKDKLI